MAKKKKLTTTGAQAHTAAVTAATAATEAAVAVIEVPAGGTLRVVVDVGPMVIPYTVAYDGNTVIKSLVDRSELVPLTPGSHILGWQFSHAVKEWHHTLGYSISGGAVKILEKKSEANKETDHSIGIALVRS